MPRRSTIGRDGTRIDRRALIVSGAALLACPAAAADRGFAIDWQGGPQTSDVARSLAAQIALVRGLAIDPAIAAFFAAQPITVDLAPDTATRAGPRGIFFERRPVPPDNPVLLHELLHRYHMLRLPGGFDNPTVIDFYRAARGSGRFPPQAYMFTNPREFFAMTASVALYGRAARPPFTRADLQAKAPRLYAWIADTFALSA